MKHAARRKCAHVLVEVWCVQKRCYKGRARCVGKAQDAVAVARPGQGRRHPPHARKVPASDEVRPQRFQDELITKGPYAAQSTLLGSFRDPLHVPPVQERQGPRQSLPERRRWFIKGYVCVIVAVRRFVK